MPMRATINLNLPSAFWTAQQSAALASNVVASIKMRTSEGLDTNDKPFKNYSKRPIYIPFKARGSSRRGGASRGPGGQCSLLAATTSTRRSRASMARVLCSR
jgi:hypothetical protein